MTSCSFIKESLVQKSLSKPGESLLSILKRKRFSISAEIIPPRNGTDIRNVFSVIDDLSKNGFDFISVTHGAGGSLRGGTLPIAHYAQDKSEMTSIAHLTCRASREEIENALVDHSYFGINNVLALRGDPPAGITEPFKVAENGHSFAYELVAQMNAMNHGEYLSRKNFDTAGKIKIGKKTNFTIGVASYPEAKETERIPYLEKKITSGAHFSITQMIFDINVLNDFYAEVVNEWGHSFPILPGIRIPTTFKMLERMHKKFDIKVPSVLLKSMRAAENKGKEAMMQVGRDWAVDFISAVFAMGMPGIHLFIMADLSSALIVKDLAIRKVFSKIK